MNGRLGLLSTLLALQLVIIAAVLFMESGFSEGEQGPFLEFEAAAVDEIRISGGGEEDSALTLTRTEAGWRLPGGLPADAAKVDEVLATLADLRAPWPVATSSGAAGRFEVASGNFQRHLVLVSDGDVVADLYLGTSPGYQQVHARRADDTAVYSVGLANYQLPPEADEWLDKTLLQPRGEVASVAREGAWELRRGDEGWLLGSAAADEGAADEGAADEGAADQEAATELVRRLSELRVTGLAEPPESAGEPEAVLAVSDEEGTYRLSLFGNDEADQYRVRSDRREAWFSLSGYVADQLVLDKQALMPSDEGTPESGE